LTIDKITGKFLLSPSDSTFTITILKEGSTAFRIIGLSEAQDHTFSYNASGTSFTYPCNFLGITKLKIFSDALSCDNLDSSVLGENNLIDTISVNAPTFGLIGFNAMQHNECLLKHKIVQNIDLQIRDERNELVDFNNQDWSITFVINSTTSEDFTPTEEFGALLKLRSNARMIQKLKENHKKAPIMEKLKEKEEEAEEDISELSDDDLELILEVPDSKK
jgi:NACalpha-BTF3-like transcription factor